MPPPELSTLSTDDPVTLATAPGLLRRFHNARGYILSIERGASAELATVRFDDQPTDTGATVVRDIPVQYLRSAAPSTRKRRSPLNLREPRDERTEAQKQAEGIATLKQFGYAALVSGQYTKRVQCPNEACGQWFFPATGYGNTRGYPDITITHPTRWAPSGCRRPALLVEYKRDEKAERKPEQEALAATGVSAFVWSTPMLLLDVYRFERDTLRIEPHPEVVAWLIQRELLPEREAA